MEEVEEVEEVEGVEEEYTETASKAGDSELAAEEDGVQLPE